MSLGGNMFNELNKMFDTRQTVKKYSDTKIENEKWEAIKDSIYWAPTSHGFEPYRVLVINRGNGLRKDLKPLMWNQGVVTEADKMIFFISLKREVFGDKTWLFKRALRKASEVASLKGDEAIVAANKQLDVILNKHLKIEEPIGDDWAMKQAYIALGMAMETAALLGVGSTPMEGLEKSKVEELFLKHELISSHERVAVALALGYPFDKKSYAHWGTGKRVRDSKEHKFKEI